MRFLKLILVLLFLAVPLVAAAQKAKTIDELAKMYDVSACKQCHAKEYAEWEKSYHATSLIGSPRTMATIGSFLRDGLMKEWTKSGVKEVKDIKVEHMMSCLKCHLPQIKDATDAVAQEIAQAVLDATGPEEAKRGPARKQLEKLGINCIICHNQKALIHEWVDGKPEPNVIYGHKGEGEHPGGALTQFKTRKKSPIMKESILCGQCHGLGPNFDLPNPTQCATLYGSYLHSYVPSGGDKTCQNCHMEKGHYMPGYRDADMAKKAVKVEVDAKGYYFLPRAGYHVPTAYISVEMVNQAGHRIPDG